jgi:hypothetical protein
MDYFSIFPDIAVFILAITSIIGLVFYVKANKKIQKLKEEKRAFDLKQNSDKEKLLDKAREKSEEMLSEASDKAMDILLQTQNFNEDSRTRLKKHFEKALKNQSTAIDKIGKELLGEYQEQLDLLKKQNINKAQNISKDLEQDLLKQAKQEIEEYKKTQFEKINLKIYDLLEIISEKVFGPGISVEKHEELVLEALEKAKKELAN